MHPRVRGGTAVRARALAATGGASPRARGNLERRHGAVGRRGCIPACAGEPTATSACVEQRGVHPRVRGGTTTTRPMTTRATGASPRARGNLGRRRFHECPVGCIPACAGEPRSPRPWSCRYGVHPRVRGGTPTPTPGPGKPSRCIPACAGEPRAGKAWGGEGGVHPRVRGGTAVLGRNDATYQGASPRARGNPGRAPSAISSRGCIPACAGEPWTRGRAPGGRRVHPRVRGGTYATTQSFDGGPGASPRARGNLSVLVHPVQHDGCIPACAGEPIGRSRFGRHSRVHPRVRGGTVVVQPHAVRRPGASPRARGNRRIGAKPNPPQGCIPACAGEPAAGPAAGRRTRVHPRVRGGTGVDKMLKVLTTGASPRARGNPHRPPRERIRRGCIPACAGEPTTGCRC